MVPTRWREPPRSSALRALGLSLAQVARVLEATRRAWSPRWPRIRQHSKAGSASSPPRSRRFAAFGPIWPGQTPAVGELARLLRPAAGLSVAFDLPWPWGGERFELSDIRPLNYIIGPLGSGKTRLAMRLAEALPDAAFLGLDRLADGGAAARARLDADPALKSRVDQTLAWLVEDGATVSDALIALLVGLESEGPAILVVDMVEQGLDQATQEALIAHLRRRGAGGRPLFLLTRSHAILDLDAVGPEETIILCPANHSPRRGSPLPGAPGYEASPPAWPRQRCGRGRKASSRGDPRWREEGREAAFGTRARASNKKGRLKSRPLPCRKQSAQAPSVPALAAA